MKPRFCLLATFCLAWVLVPASSRAQWTVHSGWPQMNRNVDVGNYWDQFTNRHYGGINAALQWPGGWDIDADNVQRRTYANYKGFVIGARNVREPQYPEATWPYMVGQRDGRNDGEQGSDILTSPPDVNYPGVTTQILFKGRLDRRTFRQAYPVVTVDGMVGHTRLLHHDDINRPPGFVGHSSGWGGDLYDGEFQFDVIDPNLPCDLQLETYSWTRMGVSNNRMVYSFVDRRNDDYMFWHWRLINDGIWGRGGVDSVNALWGAPVGTVQEVMFSMMFQWDRASRGAYKTNSVGTDNNDSIWNYYGLDYDDTVPTGDMRLVWVRDGDQDPSKFSGYSNGSQDDYGDPDPVTGEFLSARDGGLLMLHFDRSTTDRRDDRAQPITVGWANYASLIQTGMTSGMERKYNQMRYGLQDVYDNWYQGDYQETLLRGRHPHADDYSASWIKASNDPAVSDWYWPGAVLGVSPEVTDVEQQIGYGPKDIPANDTLNMIYVLGVHGVDMRTCQVEGSKWLAGTIDDAAKNALVFSAKDSLFMTMYQAKSVYESVVFDDGFAGTRYASTRDEFETALGAAITSGRLALSPPAPETFTVNSGTNHVELSWTLNTSVGSSVAGWRIYRTRESYKGDSVFSLVADLPGSATSYDDYSPTPYQNYFYYLTSVGFDGTESTMHTRTHIPVMTTQQGQPTQVSGTITTQRWTAANSPYHVVGQCTVLVANTLTIDPGVDVLFDADVQFIVEGSLQAVGTLTDSIRFIKGTASEWGGIRISGGDSSTIAYTRISDGNAEGGFPTGVGGGIRAAGSGTWLAMANCVLTGNNATGGGALEVDNGAQVSLRTCSVAGNTAESVGSAIAVQSAGALMMEECAIRGNHTFGGNALYIYESTASLTHCLLSDNAALNPGIVGSNGSSLAMTSCTIAGNVTRDDMATDGWLMLQFAPSVVTLTGAIVWGNTPARIYNDPAQLSTVTANYCDIQSETTWPGTGNINADPLFVNVGAGDYRLQSGSPCIDAGDPASPLDPDGTRADMGAFFFDQTPNALALPEVAAYPGNYVSVPITATFTGLNGADIAFTYNTDVGYFSHIEYHALQNKPNSEVQWSAYGNTVRVAMTAGGLQNSITLNDEVLVRLAFYVYPSVPRGTAMPLVWRPFPETNINEQEVLVANGSVLVQQYPYGDVSHDTNVSAYDASLILQYVVKIITSIDVQLADVTGNGFVSGYDAAHVIEKVLNPSFVLPVELVSKPTPQIQTPRLLSWVRDGSVWVLKVNDPSAIRGLDLTFGPVSGEVNVTGGGMLVSHRDGTVLRVSCARTSEQMNRVLVRLDGISGEPPELTEAQFNEGGIPLVSLRPIRFAVAQNAPNPFNPTTTIRFTTPESGVVNLAIYDVTGRFVRTLVAGSVEMGTHEAVWDGTDASGRAVSSGVYLYRVASDQGTVVRRMVLVR